MASAFEIQKYKDHLSVNWIEYLGVQNLAAAPDVVCRVLHDKINVKPRGRIAIIGVGSAISAALEVADKQLRIRHMPEHDDESHSGIFGYVHDDYEITAALAKHAKSFETS